MLLTSLQFKDYYKTGDEPSDEDDPEEFRELRRIPRRTLSTRKSYFFIKDHVCSKREGNTFTGVCLSTGSLRSASRGGRAGSQVIWFKQNGLGGPGVRWSMVGGGWG